MPKPLATRQSVRVASVQINPSTVQAVRFVTKTSKGAPMIWTKTAGFPKIILRKTKEGEVFAHLPRAKSTPIVSGEKWLDVWLEAIAQLWTNNKSKKAAAWHPAPDTKKVAAKKAPVSKKSVKAAPTIEEMEDFDDIEVVATTKKAAKVAASSPIKATKSVKIGGSKEKIGKAINMGSEFDDELSFPDA